MVCGPDQANGAAPAELAHTTNTPAIASSPGAILRRIERPLARIICRAADFSVLAPAWDVPNSDQFILTD
jgi:hypothetical protein